jgi:hypothetical protein
MLFAELGQQLFDFGRQAQPRLFLERVLVVISGFSCQY